MLFNSIEFLLFFPVVCLLYAVIPKKMRYLWLLAASYFFYMCWNAKYALLIAASTLVTWLSGLVLARGQHRKLVATTSFLINLGILGVFKYADFFFANLNWLLGHAGLELVNKPFDFVLPVGISFYTFQALGYTVDVYRGEIPPEKNLLRYALFVSFFPQLVAGPIERSKNLLSQIQTMERKALWDYERILGGCVVMLWGLFQKMVIADRLAVLVNSVWDTYYFYGTVELAAAAIGFSFQIYCDFASYSTIAIGAAKVMGFELMENFNTPYFSRSIQEFWRRWHISLSQWFKDYLYIPLGGSRCGKLRKYRNLMIVFLVSGLWHGANWTFVIWGGIHGLFQIIGAETKGLKDRLNALLHTRTDSFSYRFGQMVITFALTTFAWIFFRAPSLSEAVEYIRLMVTKPNWWVISQGGLYQLGLGHGEMFILTASLLVMYLFSRLRYGRGQGVDAFILRQCAWFQCGFVVLLFCCIFLFGIYGPGYDASQFIYNQF